MSRRTLRFSIVLLDKTSMHDPFCRLMPMPALSQLLIDLAVPRAQHSRLSLSLSRQLQIYTQWACTHTHACARTLTRLPHRYYMISQ